MNYFAHGFRFLDDPYMLAGTAVPDWLSVANRKVRVRQRQAALFVEDADPFAAALARGIVQHHRDDAWFHVTDAFGELSWRLTLACRDVLPDDPGFRPSFLGHILVELLLDAALAKKDPARLEQYYATMASIDATTVEAAVNRMAIVPAERLSWFIGRFCEVRFLWDYSDDQMLLFRLNQVLQRVGLETLSQGFIDVLRPARQMIAVEAVRLAPNCFDDANS